MPDVDEFVDEVGVQHTDGSFLYLFGFIVNTDKGKTNF